MRATIVRLGAAALVIASVLWTTPQPLAAQTLSVVPQASSSPAESTPATADGTVWGGLLFSNLFGGPTADLTHYLERYGLRGGFGDDRRRGLYADLPEVSFVYHNGRGQVAFERRVLSRYQQRGSVRADSEHLRAYGDYHYFRQAATGLDYLFGPSQVDGGVDPAYTGGSVGYLGKFNDSVRDPLFAPDRLTYNVALEVKPAVFQDKASAKVAFTGIERSGSQFGSLNLGGSDVLGTNADRRAKLRWHGYEETVDESVNEFTFTAAVRPAPSVTVEYDLGYERFRNDAQTFTFTELGAVSGIRLVSSTAEAGAEGGINAAGAETPIHFIPDSNTVRQSIRASAGNSKLFVSAGTGWNALTQRTFTTIQLADGYRRGEITSNHTFVTVAGRPRRDLRLEAYARRSGTDRRMDPFDAKLRLNAFTNFTYGVEAEVRPRNSSVVVTPGWTKRTTDRDIEWGNVPQERSLYRQDSSSSEVFVRTRWKVSPRVSLRATPSILWSDETGYVTEPTRAEKLNVALSYASAQGTRSATAFYTIRTRRNDTFTFQGVDGASVMQDARGSLQQLGVGGAATPSETANVYWSYAWSRDEYNANLFSSSVRRYDPAPVFSSRDDRQTYLLGSHSVTLGADLVPLGPMTYGVSYTATRTAGDTASGAILASLPLEDGRIESWYHTATLRVERDLGASLRLGATYLLDYYHDASYTGLTGGLNTLIVGLGYRF